VELVSAVTSFYSYGLYIQGVTPQCRIVVYLNITRGHCPTHPW